jgi:hypothetical protein
MNTLTAGKIRIKRITIKIIIISYNVRAHGKTWFDFLFLFYFFFFFVKRSKSLHKYHNEPIFFNP